ADVGSPDENLRGRTLAVGILAVRLGEAEAPGQGDKARYADGRRSLNLREIAASQRGQVHASDRGRRNGDGARIKTMCNLDLEPTGQDGDMGNSVESDYAVLGLQGIVAVLDQHPQRTARNCQVRIRRADNRIDVRGCDRQDGIAARGLILLEDEAARKRGEI